MNSPHRVKSRPPAKLWILGTTLLVAALASSCSIGSGAASTTTPSDSPSPGSGNSAAFIECLKQHGVNVPSTPPPPGPSGQLPPGTNEGDLQRAIQACGSLAPDGGVNGGASAFAAFTGCLKDHGVTLSGSGSAALGSLDRNDPKVKKALKVCQPLFPQGTGSGGG